MRFVLFSRMPELKCLGGCSSREAAGLKSKICWFSPDLRKCSVTARLTPWGRSATILGREAVTTHVGPDQSLWITYLVVR